MNRFMISAALVAGVLFYAPVLKAQTATSFEGLDVTDTVEDPATSAAGEALAQEETGDIVGSPAPVARVTTIDGEKIDFGEIYGKKPIYLKFWATWCGPCRKQTPAFERAYKELGDKVQFLAVNVGFSDDEASVRAFQKKYGMTMPIVIDDGRLGRLFHGVVTPQHVLIGRDGRFAYIGHAENEALRTALQAAVDSEAPATVAAPAEVAPESVVSIGEVVPDTSVTLLDGKQMSLKAQPNRLLAVELFSSWCEWYLEESRPVTANACAKVREEIEKLATQIGDVDWVGVAGGPWTTKEDLTDYQTNNNVAIPLAVDKGDALFRTFGIRAIPSIVLINDEGRLLKVIGPDEAAAAGGIQKALEAAGFGSAAEKVAPN